MYIELFIPLRLRSPNQLLNMHWRKREKYFRQVAEEVLVAKNMAGVKGRPMLSPVRLDVTLQLWRSKGLDYDNAVAACKPLIDGIVRIAEHTGRAAGLTTAEIQSLFEASIVDQDIAGTRE